MIATIDMTVLDMTPSMCGEVYCMPAEILDGPDFWERYTVDLRRWLRTATRLLAEIGVSVEQIGSWYSTPPAGISVCARWHASDPRFDAPETAARVGLDWCVHLRRESDGWLAMIAVNSDCTRGAVLLPWTTPTKYASKSAAATH